MTTFHKSQVFDVFRPVVRDLVFFTSGLELVDTVFYAERAKMSAEDVRKELIEHDGYPADIVVRIGK